ncbi:hypothetical protein [Methanococcoides alaskense]|uniref:Uncharacterized protein n=1 Tax=Methanococcoides alaskense TaxID=325778 RepID=A0AA90TZ76_9EURY|nr:hypothetical protein [Methanococcoides alaskense]MDA0525737.1 hypothetical protein [Methanococcoides alaskense]MDR6222963.1 hypothetical protein [Methanococcoides alaskense]
MKNTYIPLLVLTVLAVISAGAMIMNADADEKILIDNGGLESENSPAVDGGNNDKMQPLNTIATIIGIETWDNTTVLLLDQDESDIGEGYPCDIYLKISQETTIKDSNGNELTIEDLTEETRIEAYYGPATTRSLPAQSVAVSIVVLDENDQPGVPQPVKTTGTILGTEKWTSSTVILLDEDDVEIGEGYPCDIYLSIGQETTITDSNGNELTIEDLTEGMRIEAYYGPMVTASLPPQSGTLKIVVLSE